MKWSVARGDSYIDMEREELVARIKNGEITEADSVWQEGFEDWQTVGDCPQLYGALKAAHAAKIAAGASAKKAAQRTASGRSRRSGNKGVFIGISVCLVLLLLGGGAAGVYFLVIKPAAQIVSDTVDWGTGVLESAESGDLSVEEALPIPVTVDDIPDPVLSIIAGKLEMEEEQLREYISAAGSSIEALRGIENIEDLQGLDAAISESLGISLSETITQTVGEVSAEDLREYWTWVTGLLSSEAEKDMVWSREAAGNFTSVVSLYLDAADRERITYLLEVLQSRANVSHVYVANEASLQNILNLKDFVFSSSNILDPHIDTSMQMAVADLEVIFNMLKGYSTAPNTAIPLTDGGSFVCKVVGTEREWQISDSIKGLFGQIQKSQYLYSEMTILSSSAEDGILSCRIDYGSESDFNDLNNVNFIPPLSVEVTVTYIDDTIRYGGISVSVYVDGSPV